VFLGDFKVSFNNHSHLLYSNFVLNYLIVQDLTQVMVGPRNAHHDGSTYTIDLVFVPDPSLVNSCKTIPPLSNSDLMESLWNLIGSLKTKYLKGPKYLLIQACPESYCHYALSCQAELLPPAKPKGPKDVMENCQAHNQEQTTNPNPVTIWHNG